ncbi:SDR family NAD(P)-dependent oxidoreductase, partial [Vibrio parahaemolyticus]
EFMTTSLEDHLRMLDVNCRGPLTLARQLAPRLQSRGRGGVVLMSSMSGFQGAALLSTYAATKAFDTVLAEGLWAELRTQGVNV